MLILTKNFNQFLLNFGLTGNSMITDLNNFMLSVHNKSIFMVYKWTFNLKIELLYWLVPILKIWLDSPPKISFVVNSINYIVVFAPQELIYFSSNRYALNQLKIFCPIYVSLRSLLASNRQVYELPAWAEWHFFAIW